MYRRRSFWTEVKMDLEARKSNIRYYIPRLIMWLLIAPEIQLLFSYRIQNRLIRVPLVGKFLAKILWLITYWTTNCQVGSRARIEGGIFLPHAMSIVIGNKCLIKSGVTIFHHVTIGGDKIGNQPTILDGAVIYTGAVVFGDIIIGRNSIVGANAVISQSIPDNMLTTVVRATTKKG